MAAVLAPARCVVLKELNFMATFGTIGLKYGSWLPVTGVLSRAFHRFAPIILISGVLCYILDSTHDDVLAVFFVIMYNS